MTKPSMLDRQLAELNISELKSVQHLEAMQKEMLKLLKRSSVDPISYVGLDYCSPYHCGRLNCSEACWFGTLRRRVPEVLIRRLIEQHGRSLHKVIAWKPDWGCLFGELQQVTPVTAKAFMTRVLNLLYNPEAVAIGTFKMVPFAGADRWISEIHVIIGGANETDLESTFAPWVPETSVRIKKIVSLNETIDEVTSCNMPRLFQHEDERPEAAQQTEFCTWLLNMKLGSRLFRFGCDTNFQLITNRTIAPKRPKKLSRRRYAVRRKRSRSPGVASADYYYDDN
jgi:hypothetical protein